MAANDDFPREWIFDTVTGSILIPAVPGIVHVLTSVLWNLYTSGATAALNSAIQVLFGGVVSVTLGPLNSVAQGGAGAVSTFTWQGKIAAPIGQSLAVQNASALIANYQQRGFITGMDE